MEAHAVRLEELRRWSATLAAIARTGLGFSASVFERERFEEILAVAGDIAAAAASEAAQRGAEHDAGPAGEKRPDPAELVAAWTASVRDGIAGYVTPRVSVGAVVGNDAGEILLVQRADSGAWLYPTGWADVGYSAAEVAVKEVREETGMRVEPLGLIMVLDGLRLGAGAAPLYSLVFHCRLLGGELRAHPLECREVGWFGREALPEPLAGRQRWVEQAFAAIDGEAPELVFDRPREPHWRAEPAS